MPKLDKISLFVTGGWDSSFMLCKLSRLAIKITPIYILNEKRESREYELAAIDKIIRAILKHPATKATIAPLKIIDLKKVDIKPEIVAARRGLMKRAGILGYQYDYLATIASIDGPVGVGIEKSPPASDTGATVVLSKYAKLVPGPYGLVVDKQHSDPAVNVVFGNLFFPIAEITEPEMRDWADKNKYTEIMKMTWFCHSPINGSPCGLCRPCEEKMGSNMEFLLPKDAKDRYYKAKKWSYLGERLSRPLKNCKLRHLKRKAKACS